MKCYSRRLIALPSRLAPTSSSLQSPDMSSMYIFNCSPHFRWCRTVLTFALDRVPTLQHHNYIHNYTFFCCCMCTCVSTCVSSSLSIFDVCHYLSRCPSLLSVLRSFPCRVTPLSLPFCSVIVSCLVHPSVHCPLFFRVSHSFHFVCDVSYPLALFFSALQWCVEYGVAAWDRHSPVPSFESRHAPLPKKGPTREPSGSDRASDSTKSLFLKKQSRMIFLRLRALIEQLFLLEQLDQLAIQENRGFLDAQKEFVLSHSE